MEKTEKKDWTKPEIKTVTGFNVHENVIASSDGSENPWGPNSPDNVQGIE